MNKFRITAIAGSLAGLALFASVAGAALGLSFCHPYQGPIFVTRIPRGGAARFALHFLSFTHFISQALSSAAHGEQSYRSTQLDNRRRPAPLWMVLLIECPLGNDGLKPLASGIVRQSARNASGAKIKPARMPINR